MNSTTRLVRRKGFTIIELLIVVIVIGVLASAGVAKYQGFAESARQKTCISNQSMIENAGAVWQTQNTSARDDCWGAGPYRKDGYYMDWWGCGLPWRSSFSIADIVRDPKAFACPRTVQRFGSYQNVPNGWYGEECWAGNYIHYYQGPGQGAWNGWLYYLQSGSSTGLQMVICPAWGMYACTPQIGAKYKHSNKWN